MYGRLIPLNYYAATAEEYILKFVTIKLFFFNRRKAEFKEIKHARYE